MYAFSLSVFRSQLHLSTFIIFHVVDVASDDGDVVAARLEHEKGNGRSATDCFVVHKTLLH